MRTRTIREGSVGLLILLGLGLLGGLILWLRGMSLGNKTYEAIVEFKNVAGLQEGAPVRYRGVTIGKIASVHPGPNGVDVKIQIASADFIIPRTVVVEANQSGLISETSIDITPTQTLPANTIAGKPLSSDCNPNVIVCDGGRLQGKIGISVDELIRSSIQFAQLYGNPSFFANVNQATKNTADAAASIAQVSKEVAVLSQSVKQNLDTVSTSAITSANAVGAAANQIAITANQVNGLVNTNRNALTSTLNSISLTSEQLRVSVQGLTPTLDRFQQSALLQNLETLSANAALASANLRDASNTLNTPTNVLMLQQTLDSARATFQNAQKITADLDELTGDPEFRENIRNLVNDLSGLVSSTQNLEQQTRVAQTLTPLMTTIQEKAESEDHTKPSTINISPELAAQLQQLVELSSQPMTPPRQLAPQASSVATSTTEIPATE